MCNGVKNVPFKLFVENMFRIKFYPFVAIGLLSSHHERKSGKIKSKYWFPTSFMIEVINTYTFLYKTNSCIYGFILTRHYVTQVFTSVVLRLKMVLSIQLMMLSYYFFQIKYASKTKFWKIRQVQIA